ncbi:hypothetical protein R8Z57_07745 [Microbacterium sp. M3]|uniref:Uncharacterized protein n=1 Tax=Microbacterium arthrosphaerae TaxID=792652 RepID=A0ABU4H050_9MICO|nr:MULTISPECIES: hypothetical protein [Microbacterium]MDW4572668.1 hypothetical protein [Microbacterium arthrosphaerae]MDW7606523.1 hypothetical protein [Microbacterium sp. M3]
MSDERLEQLSGPALAAAATLLRVVEPSREISKAIRQSGRTVVDLRDGQVTCGWSDLTDDAWSGDGIEQVRWSRQPAPRLARTMAAVLRCCWPVRDASLYPGQPSSKGQILNAYAKLGAIGSDEIGDGVSRHAIGALTTLEATGLVTWDRDDDSIRLGPVVATWSSRAEETLRVNWDRLPSAEGA